MYFGLIVPAYSYAYFAPSIIQGYGYNRMCPVSSLSTVKHLANCIPQRSKPNCTPFPRGQRHLGFPWLLLSALIA